MACRYLDNRGHARICRACEPLREPSRGEQKAFCQASEQVGCDFFRFRRATGRALRLEDFLAWQRKRATDAARDAEGAGEPA